MMQIRDEDQSHQITRASSSESSRERSEAGIFSGEEWLDAGETFNCASASDSAYGTLDEADEPAQLKKKDSIKRKTSLSRKRGKSTTRSNSVGDSSWIHPLPFRDSDLDSLSSADSSPTPTPHSELFAPDGSESDFHSASLLRRTRSSLLSAPLQLSRRHTLPRRCRARALSLTITLVAPDSDVTHSTDLLVSHAPLTHAIALLTVTLSLLSLVVPLPLLPVSPAYLLHPRQHLTLELANSLFSPLLVTPSLSAIALGVMNLKSLRDIERRRNWGLRAGVALLGLTWASVLLVRVAAAWLFGRGLGWAYPSLFSNNAVHQVGSGLAPLLLSLYVMLSASSSGSLTEFASLAASFAVPVKQGGTDLWWGMSAVLVGLVGAGLLEVAKVVRKSKSARDSRKSSSLFPRLASLALIFLPFLALLSSTPSPSPTNVNFALADLFPHQSNLLTILLMTAPRPGNPDFLRETIHSWLHALPDPSSASTNSTDVEMSDRIRLVVYTHFSTHDLFDAARDYFTSSPLYAEKANRYIEWQRDPRAVDRYDQTLHLARGLAHVTQPPFESAYVLLTEDDFPLCPTIDSHGQKSWKESWDQLVRAIVDTNSAMPDSSIMVPGMDVVEEERSAGHCGVFIATGGSGLAIRGFLAAKLPAILLGSDDVDGDAREARADRGEENEDQRPPDLVIQDCLRGRIDGCEVCAPPTPALSPRSWSELVGERSKSRFPLGSARNPSPSTGDRWGKSGLSVTPRMMQHHLGYNSSTFQNRKYGADEFSCQWRMPLNGEADVLTL